MTAAFVGTLAGLGFVGAFVAGLVGVGGAIITMPLLFYVPPLLGVGALDIKLVAGVTMGQVLAASLVGAAIHGGASRVHRSLAVVAGTSMATASLAGAVASRYVGGRVLLAVFGIMGLLALFLLLLPPAEAATPGTADIGFDRTAAVAYPAVIGLLSGLVGAGGAFLLMPVFVGVMRIPLRLSIGTSLAVTVASSLTGFVGKLLTAQVPLWPTLAVVAGSLSGVTIGARLSGRAPVGVLRGVLGVLIALSTLRVWADLLVR